MGAADISSSSLASPARLPRKSSHSASAAPASPRRSYNAGPAGFRATESVSNILSITSFFTARISESEKARQAQHGADEAAVLDAEDVLQVIAINLGGVELIESDALEDMPRLAEREHARFLEEALPTVCEQALALSVA